MKSATVTAEFIFLFTGGDGIVSAPFEIETYEEFVNIKKYPSASYILKNDLNLKNINHSPLFGSDKQKFEGGFDGNNKKIINLTINNKDNYPSLFGIVGDNGTVKNLTIENVAIITANYDTADGNFYCVGGIAGISYGILENINAQIKIEFSEHRYGYVAIGGLVGMACNGISDCSTIIDFNINNILPDKPRIKSVGIGGLAGYGLNVSIMRCNSTGAIKANNTESEMLISGLIGIYNSELKSNLFIENSYADVNIVSVGNTEFTASGFIGEIENGRQSNVKIENCFASGDISNAGLTAGFIYSGIGGADENNMRSITINNCYSNNNLSGNSIVGFIYNAYWVIISQCHYEGNIEATSSSAGFGKTFHDSLITQCYVDGIVNGGPYATGFIQTLQMSEMDQCFMRGNIVGLYGAGGLCFTIDSSAVKNSYAISDLNITNDNPNPHDMYRTLAGGFAYRIFGSVVENCYYAGDIRGITYTTSTSLVYALGKVFNSQITNFHLLYREKSFTLGIYPTEIDETTQIKLTTYENIAEMYRLADILNGQSAETIWVNKDNELPILAFESYNNSFFIHKTR